MMLRAWGSLLAGATCDFLYPPACYGCSRPLQRTKGGVARFCLPCQTGLAPALPNRCMRCSAPVGPYVSTEAGCSHCQRWTWSFDQVVSVGAYQNQLRVACLRCKGRGQTALASALTGLLLEREAVQLRNWQPDVVIPVPHHWLDRIRQDHAASAVGEQLGQQLQLPVQRNWLNKSRRTQRQMSLSAAARQQNLRGVFRVPRSARLQGRTVLLTDDILTTGMTAHYCTKELLQAGAARVVVAVLARGLTTP